MSRQVQTRACFRRGFLAKFARQNISNLLDFVATRHCQGNPRPSLITEIRLTCTAALRVLLGSRLRTKTLYSYSAFKVQNLPSSAEAFQLASRLNSFESITLPYNIWNPWYIKIVIQKCQAINSSFVIPLRVKSQAQQLRRFKSPSLYTRSTQNEKCMMDMLAFQTSHLSN